MGSYLGALAEIARALMFDPKLLLLDEPFAGINPRLQNRILGYLERLRREGVTPFLIDHEMRILLTSATPPSPWTRGRSSPPVRPEVIHTDPRGLAGYF